MKSEGGARLEGYDALIARLKKYNKKYFADAVNCNRDYYIFRPGLTEEDDSLSFRFSTSTGRDVGFMGGLEYASAEEAAIAVLRDALPRSVTDKAEYGGMIGKTTKGTYVASSPHTSHDPMRVDSTGLNYLPIGTIPAASYHTHIDAASMLQSDKDQWNVKEKMLRMYMANMYGEVHSLDPITMKEPLVGQVVKP